MWSRKAPMMRTTWDLRMASPVSFGSVSSGRSPSRCTDSTCLPFSARSSSTCITRMTPSSTLSRPTTSRTPMLLTDTTRAGARWETWDSCEHGVPCTAWVADNMSLKIYGTILRYQFFVWSTPWLLSHCMRVNVDRSFPALLPPRTVQLWENTSKTSLNHNAQKCT